MDAAEQWDELVRPWRAVAERHGFRLLKRSVQLIAGGHRCIDHLVSGATFLDLAGELGATHGFWSATLVTWIDLGEARFSSTTVGERLPRPRPRGIAGWFVASLIAPLMHRLASPDARPMPMREPGDLEAVIAKHTADLLALAGKPVQFDTLEYRFEQERRDTHHR